MPPSMRTDVHQHLLPEDLIAALSRRTQAPRIANGELHVAGEPPSAVRPRGPRPDARAAARRPRPHRRSPSRAPSASRACPADEAEPLLEAFNRGILELGEPVRAVGRREPRHARAPRPSTSCSTPARSASRCPPPRSPTAAACATSRRCSTAWRRAARRSSSTPALRTVGPLGAAVVARADQLRRRHERGLARLRDLGPPAPSAAADRLRDARRRRAAARRAARRARRAGGRRSTTRSPGSTSPPTGRSRSTR